MPITPYHLLSIFWGDEIGDCKVYRCNYETERRQQAQSYNNHLGNTELESSSTASVKEVQWGSRLPTSGSSVRYHNHWARSTEGILWDKSVMCGCIRGSTDSFQLYIITEKVSGKCMLHCFSVALQTVGRCRKPPGVLCFHSAIFVFSRHQHALPGSHLGQSLGSLLCLPSRCCRKYWAFIRSAELAIFDIAET